MDRTLSGKVVVITGASSGIGRAAAIRFAAKGARLVLAGRRAEALEATAIECRVVGGHAVSQQSDVTSEADMNALATRALEQTGSIDVWVNNAGVTLFGALETTPFEDHRRVIETNLFGAMHGARAVLPIFRRQQRGVMINVGSILSKIGQPFVPSYVISKFALRGLTEALRAEVADQYDIHVCSLLPYAVDTEHFEGGANHVGRETHPLPPVQSPEKVAAALVHLAQHPVRERHVPRVAVFGLALHALFSRAVERTVFDALTRWHFGDRAEPETRGNLDRPQKPDGAVHGERQPRLSAAGLIAYGARRFASVELELVRRALARAGLQQGSRGGRSASIDGGSASRSLEEKVRALHEPA
jgi:NAD(P)-dependent dehydrogenase (short-subunit alcohol dehydrogenase family)